MISRSTLVAALVVVELTIVGAAIRSFSGDGEPATAEASGRHGPASPVLDRHFATGPAPHVVIDVGDVAVVIEAGSDPGVRVVEHVGRRSGWAGGAVPPVSAVQTADGVRIVSRGAVRPHFTLGCTDHSLLVRVPAGANVEVTSTDRIEASGLRTRFTAHSDNGSIHVQDQRGAVDVHSENGRIELSDVRAAEVTAHTANGRLVLTRVSADRLQGSTENGRIEANGVRLTDGALTTSNGRIRLAYTADSDAAVTVHSASGRLDIPSDPVGASGDETDGDGHQRIVHLGAARGRFEVSSDNGSINLSQGAQV